MNLGEAVDQIKYKLQEIEIKEQVNQQEQATISSNIERIEEKLKSLESELQENYQRQSQLDLEAIELCRQSEEFQSKLNNLEKIVALSQEYKTLQLEFKDNQDLLNTLHSSITTMGSEDIHADYQIDGLENQNQESEDNQDKEEPESDDLNIDYIKSILPDAEKIYQKLVAHYLEEYHTYQNLIVDGLDLIWCSVAFIAFGRSSYRQMSRKHHPDLEGSDRAMQLINKAWEIAQAYSKENS